MKIIYKYKLVFFAAALFLAACEKNIKEPVFEAYLPVNQDSNAGTWKTYVLKSPEEIEVTAPRAANSSEYLAELAALKATISNLNAEKQQAISYWGTGAVYRWNEIARELAAKYNLAPPAKADGTYGVPDRANPLAEPRFPFANPPYTARALAYLSVAQYDALVSARYYQNKYKRSGPSKFDQSLITLLPITDQPSYPSDEAVVAAASYTVLLNMFPGETTYLFSKLEEAKNASLWSGRNVPTDIYAGSELGKAVAAKVLARAAADGMGAANNQALVAEQKVQAALRGVKDIWESQEKPARPPMLPNYGAVTTWNFDKNALKQIRPTLPYIAGSAEWQKEFTELQKINKSQTREQARIASFWSDGAGSYTPPGHWHRTAANIAHEAKFSEVRMARTLAALGTALMDAGIACWDTKYYYYTPRPQQFGIKTSVGLPNFPSYTSGHSTFSAAAATVLGSIFPEKAKEFDAQAKEASESRIFGLIHFRVDCEMGLVHGKKIGEYAVARGKADGSGL